MRRLLLTAVALVVLGSPGVAQASLTEYGTSPIGTSGSGEGQFNAPVGVDVNTSTGDVYVADRANHRIQRFTEDGDFISAFGWGVDDGSAALQVCTSGCQAGISGNGAGQLSDPSGLAIDQSTGDVYVVNAADGRIVRFNADGTYVSTFADSLGSTYFSDTAAFNPVTGNLYIALPSRTVVFDPSGVAQPDFPGTASYIGAADFDAAGNLYLTDTASAFAGVRVYDSSGTQFRTLLATKQPGVVAVDRATGHVLVGDQPADIIDSESFVFRELDETGGSLVSSFADGLVRLPTPTFSGQATYGGSAFNATAALPGTEGGVYYLADTRRDKVSILSRIARAPRIASSSPTKVGAGSAELRGVIDPMFRQTEHHYEYGTTTSYGAVTTAKDVGADGAEHATRAVVDGLKPNTTYHFRIVAENAVGTTTGPDRVFTTDSLGGLPKLPDGRVYEQVSPVAKNDADLQGPMGVGGPVVMRASAAGNSIAYGVSGAYPGPQSSLRQSVVRSLRGESAWTSSILNPPRQAPFSVAPQDVFSISDDHSHTLVFSRLALAPGAVEDLSNVYVRDNRTGAFELVCSIPTAGNDIWPVAFLGGSTDFGIVVIESTEALTPDAQPGQRHWYQWKRGAGLSLVDVLPDGSPSPSGAGAGSNSPGTSADEDPVSTDGRRIVFWTPDGRLYLRQDGKTTIPLSVSRRPGDPAAPVSVGFNEMSEDGSKIVFTSGTPLTPDASATRAEAYRYDVDSGQLTAVTAGISVGDPGDRTTFGGTTDGGVNAVSPDGSTVVFSLRAQVDTPDYTRYTTTPQIYVWRNGTQRLVTGAIREWLAGFPARISPNGRYIVFTTRSSVAGAETGGFDQIYRYDADLDKTVCISCRPSGEASQGTASGTDRDYSAFPEENRRRNVMNDGRVFFNTTDSLTPLDTNGAIDVYRWDNGRAELISDGVTPSGSAFADASASGDDVFFATRARLVRQDRDNYADIYDARVGGGLAGQNPTVPLPPCAGDECQPDTQQAPALPGRGSATFQGPSDPSEPSVDRPTARLTVSTAKRVRARSGTVTVTASSAGTITVSGPSLTTVKRKVRAAGKAKLTFKLTAKGIKQLSKAKRLKVRLKVTFAPASGKATVKTVTVTFEQPSAKRSAARAGSGQRGGR